MSTLPPADRHPACARAGSPSPSRRKFLGLFPAALLAACGGGGGGDEPASGGLLVYRSGAQVGVYDLALRRETLFTPQGQALFTDPGVAISRQRRIAVIENFQLLAYQLNVYDTQGARIEEDWIPFDRYTVVSPGMLSPDGRWAALSHNEPISVFGAATTRVHIYETSVLPHLWRHFQLTGYTAPVWAGAGGELMARNVADGSVHLFSSAFADLGALPAVRTDPGIGVFDVDPDGARLVYVQDGEVRMVDRGDYAPWRALSVSSGTLTRPAFTPDGSALVAVWHRANAEVIVLARWQRGTTVAVDDSMILPGISGGQFTGRLSTAP